MHLHISTSAYQFLLVGCQFWNTLTHQSRRNIVMSHHISAWKELDILRGKSGVSPQPCSFVHQTHRYNGQYRHILGCLEWGTPQDKCEWNHRFLKYKTRNFCYCKTNQELVSSSAHGTTNYESRIFKGIFSLFTFWVFLLG